jgi:Na+-translocating ferredoxin:NAD+ oxidoreductase RnfD subunit
MLTMCQHYWHTYPNLFNVPFNPILLAKALQIVAFKKQGTLTQSRINANSVPISYAHSSQSGQYASVVSQFINVHFATRLKTFIIMIGCRVQKLTVCQSLCINISIYAPCYDRLISR